MAAYAKSAGPQPCSSSLNVRLLASALGLQQSSQHFCRVRVPEESGRKGKRVSCSGSPGALPSGCHNTSLPGPLQATPGEVQSYTPGGPASSSDSRVPDQSPSPLKQARHGLRTPDDTIGSHPKGLTILDTPSADVASLRSEAEAILSDFRQALSRSMTLHSGSVRLSQDGSHGGSSAAADSKGQALRALLGAYTDSAPTSSTNTPGSYLQSAHQERPEPNSGYGRGGLEQQEQQLSTAHNQNGVSRQFGHILSGPRARKSLPWRDEFNPNAEGAASEASPLALGDATPSPSSTQHLQGHGAQASSRSADRRDGETDPGPAAARPGRKAATAAVNPPRRLTLTQPPALPGPAAAVDPEPGATAQVPQPPANTVRTATHVNLVGYSPSLITGGPGTPAAHAGTHLTPASSAASSRSRIPGPPAAGPTPIPSMASGPTQRTGPVPTLLGGLTPMAAAHGQAAFLTPQSEAGSSRGVPSYARATPPDGMGPQPLGFGVSGPMPSSTPALPQTSGGTPPDPDWAASGNRGYGLSDSPACHASPSVGFPFGQPAPAPDDAAAADGVSTSPVYPQYSDLSGLLDSPGAPYDDGEQQATPTCFYPHGSFGLAGGFGAGRGSSPALSMGQEVQRWGFAFPLLVDPASNSAAASPHAMEGSFPPPEGAGTGLAGVSKPADPQSGQLHRASFNVLLGDAAAEASSCRSADWDGDDSRAGAYDSTAVIPASPSVSSAGGDGEDEGRGGGAVEGQLLGGFRSPEGWSRGACYAGVHHADGSFGGQQRPRPEAASTDPPGASPTFTGRYGTSTHSGLVPYTPNTGYEDATPRLGSTLAVSSSDVDRQPLTALHWADRDQRTEQHGLVHLSQATPPGHVLSYEVSWASEAEAHSRRQTTESILPSPPQPLSPPAATVSTPATHGLQGGAAYAARSSAKGGSSGSPGLPRHSPAGLLDTPGLLPSAGGVLGPADTGLTWQVSLIPSATHQRALRLLVQ